MRRRALLGRCGAIAAAGAVAGCLDQGAIGSGEDPDSDDGNASNDGDEGGNGSGDGADDETNGTDDSNAGDSDDADGSNDDGSPTLEEYEVEQVAATGERSDWAESDDPSGGHLEVFDDAETAREELAFDDLDDDDRRGELETFVEETDFETSLLLYVVSVAPDASYDEIEVRELDVEDDALVGTAAAAGGDAEVAAQVITYPSALVRAAFEDGRPGTVELTVVDGWGEECTLEESV